MEISAAEAMCLNDEPNWKTKPLFQLRSMAQTRSCAKALRNVLAWVVVLAGYRATPAEEIQDMANENKAPLKQPEKKAPPAGAPLIGTISDISTAQGETKGKPWTRYDLTIDGVRYSTFSDTFADIARTAKESGASVTFTFTAGERGNTIKTLEVAPEREVGSEG
jgi:hypothetical protein